MPNLTLDQNHQYRLDNKPIDGFTSTIQEAGLTWNCDPQYFLKGTDIHYATEYHDKGTLESSLYSFSEEIYPYLESWKKFRHEQDYHPLEIEYMTYHPELMVGTKIDRLPGPLDIKSGIPQKWHILQIAFQWACLKAHNLGNLAQCPMDVYLSEDGSSPKVKTYTQSEMREAFKVYCSMLHFIRWRRG